MASKNTSPGSFPAESDWYYDFLPVQRPGALWPELGVLLPGSATAYLVNMMDLARPGALEACEKLPYVSLAAAHADGWRTD